MTPLLRTLSAAGDSINHTASMDLYSRTRIHCTGIGLISHMLVVYMSMFRGLDSISLLSAVGWIDTLEGDASGDDPSR